MKFRQNDQQSIQPGPVQGRTIFGSAFSAILPVILAARDTLPVMRRDCAFQTHLLVPRLRPSPLPQSITSTRRRRHRRSAPHPRSHLLAELEPVAVCRAALKSGMVFVIDSRLLAVTAIVTVLYQFAFGTVAYAFKFDKVTVRPRAILRPRLGGSVFTAFLC